MATVGRVLNPIYTFFPAEIEGFDALAELALDMHWYWNHSADELWSELDPALWELTYNPWVILQTASRDRLQQALSDPAFRERLNNLLEKRREEMESAGWFQKEYPKNRLTHVAYFSMEFMLNEALPIYSGGLGNVAGDQLKTASDLGVPVVGVGLLYQQGYFRQIIDKDGVQQELFPYNDPGQLPIMPLREPNGEWLRLELTLPGYSVWLRGWQVQVGRTKLYLLDSNDPANLPDRRGITSELYGGGPELRLKQALVLGIGGWRLLNALGIRPEVCHLNEGHAAFAVLERARAFMEETGQSFEVSLAATRAGNLFTTHTPVNAGFDRFAPSIIEPYLARYADKRLGIPLRDLMALGRKNPDDASEPFNMAYLAMRGSGAVNGVSRLHGQVSRKIFQPLFARWPEQEVPVGHVTNGVHMTSWESEETDALWTASCGSDRWLGTLKTLGEDMRTVSDERLWECRSSARQSLVEYVRRRLSRQLEAAGAASDEVEHASRIFDPDTLTLGFARRFTTYKRPNLLLFDEERLVRLLTDLERPVQLIVAGKAHPADHAGRALVEQWTHFVRRSDARKQAIFLSDYDMLLTGQLVQGIDVWINTPKRPWEACGTSGMKVLVNGGLNLSELDGWWEEAYTPEVGWALGDGGDHRDDPSWDAREAAWLYDILENQVVAEFYDRNSAGIPVAWVSRIRESMSRLTPRFSANRTVREYVDRYYIPASENYRKRAADNGRAAVELTNWRHDLEKGWPQIRFGDVRVTSAGGVHRFEVQIYLGCLDPEMVRVELYADGASREGPIRHELSRTERLALADSYLYSGEIPSTRAAQDFTARIIPGFHSASVPLEAAPILWQR
ncbi:MAG TPA: alpha-glucan family phosphorylase [Syntrophorhabdaceae bacterium]|nr:alpha-glucan family phosphorylase [Syntrophorhabdaceae bacterium]